MSLITTFTPFTTLWSISSLHSGYPKRLCDLYLSSKTLLFYITCYDQFALILRLYTSTKFYGTWSIYIGFQRAFCFFYFRNVGFPWFSWKINRTRWFSFSLLSSNNRTCWFSYCDWRKTTFLTLSRHRLFPIQYLRENLNERLLYGTAHTISDSLCHTLKDCGSPIYLSRVDDYLFFLLGLQTFCK